MGEVKKLNQKVEEKATESKTSKLTYEQLTAIASQLQSQCTYLQKQVEMLSETSFLKRLEFLFKIVDNVTGVFSRELTDRSVKEIEEIMFPPMPEAKDINESEQNKEE